MLIPPAPTWRVRTEKVYVNDSWGKGFPVTQILNIWNSFSSQLFLLSKS